MISSIALAAVVAMSFVAPVHAQVSMEKLPEDTVFNDFVVGPGKFDVELEPGETRTFQLSVSNRLGFDKTFILQLEDFTGSRDPSRPVMLLGNDRGPYSLRDYLRVATTSLVIPHGYKSRILVTVRVPADAQPGGLYGSVVVSTATLPGQIDNSAGSAGKSPIITRIGTLFLVRVKGPVNAEGQLSKFSLSGGRTVLWNSDPVSFNLLYENNGNVHLNPFGNLSVKNMMGSTVGSVDIEPWFAMPESLRFREVIWNPPFLFGRYVARAEINRGYGNLTDEADLVFWVIPWKIIALILVALIVLIGGVKWMASRFTIVSRKKRR